MAKRGRPKGSVKRLPSQCPECGADQETVWMMSGKMIAVDPVKIEVIFANQANAGGHRMGAYVEHKCGKGER